MSIKELASTISYLEKKIKDLEDRIKHLEKSRRIDTVDDVIEDICCPQQSEYLKMSDYDTDYYRDW